MKTTKLTSLLILTTSVAVAATTSLAAEAAAQKEKAPAPAETRTVEQVLARYVKARGRQTALEKTTTLVTKGTVEGLERVGLTLPVNFELSVKVPDKTFQLVTDANGTFIQEAVEGTNGWRIQQGNLRDKTPDEIVLNRSTLRLFLAQKLTESFPTLTLKGKEDTQGREADVVEATTPEGQLFTLYFETKTGLLLRITTEFHGMPMRYDFEDYRDVEGVKFPYKLSVQEGSLPYTAYFKEIKRNAPIDEAKFKKPSQ